MRGVANILHGAAIILPSMTSTLSDVPDILHVQHQFFEIFLVFWDFQGEKFIFSISAQK